MSVEREVKLALPDEEAYERLCARLGTPQKDVIQENTYWDRPDGSLTAAGLMLRLRRVGERSVVTVKGAAERDVGGVFQSFEDEETVPPAMARDVLDGTLEFERMGCGVLDRLAERVGPLGALRRWGRMENRRRAYPWKGFLLEVDRTVFSQDRVEWEVEVESDEPQEAAAAVRGLLDDLGIPYEAQRKTKSERLREVVEEEGMI